MASGISEISSRAAAAYGVNQTASAKSVDASGSITAGAVMPTNKAIGVPRISDTVEISDKAYDLLLTPGNYRPNVKAAPVENRASFNIIDIIA